MKRPQVVDCEARRHDINGGHMRKQALALLHTWTWVTSRTYAESHRQAAIGDRPGPRIMQSCSCVRSRTHGGINKRTVCPPPFCFDLPRRRRADATGGRRYCSDPILAVPRPTERQRCCESPGGPERAGGGNIPHQHSDPPEHGYIQLCYRLRRYGCTAHAWAGGRGTAAFLFAPLPACGLRCGAARRE